MIIDCHTHINYYEDESTEALPQCLDRLLTSMRRNRVDVSLVLTSYKVTPARPSTRAAVAATAHLPNVHVVAGLSWATFSKTDVDDLRQLLEEKAIRALKIYPCLLYTSPSPRD